ncbi:MAG: DUF3857 domain-containing protein [Candidatus Eisenbacteria bacterium]|uniref:DUF3857 domain-containing protein n=1 Tax=Eiseniibacteriota bacterium TaxID=2212470 RepID=A0A956NIM8_UNCEI|nr:DUF3857 domain-containing protein [Candidatus Eisenbacteria bacterium]
MKNANESTVSVRGSLWILALLLILTGGCRPAFRTMAEIQRAYDLPPLPTAEQYPDFDAVVVLATVDTELYGTDRGLWTDQVFHRIVRVFRNAETRANVEIDLFPGEQLVALEARIHTPEGRILPIRREEVDLGRANVPLPGTSGSETSVDNASIEKNTVRLHFEGLVPGATYEYRYRLRRKEPYLYDSWAVQEYDPVLFAQYRLTVPQILYDEEGKEWDWRYRYYRCARIGSPVIVEENNPGLGLTETYTWTLRDVPGFTPEPRMPPHEEYLSYARFAHTAWETWDEVTESYWTNHLTEALEPDDRVAEALRDILSSGATSMSISGSSLASDDELSRSRRKVAAIARYVQQMPAIDLELGQGSLTPAKPAKVLERGRADTKDKAVLLVALLRETGYEADPALVVTRDHGPLDAKFPNWSFNHMLVLVELGSERIWIDPTARHYPFGELPWRSEGVEAVVVRTGGTAELLITPRPEAKHNSHLTEVRMTVGTDGQTRGDVEMILDGEPGSLLLGALDTISEKNGTDRRDAVRQWCESEIRSTYADAAVTSIELRETSPGRALVSFAFETHEVIVDDILPHLSAYPFPFDAGLDLIGQVERRFPVENGYPSTWTRRITVDLEPSEYAVAAVPSNVDIHDREIAFESRFEIQGEQTVRSEETLTLRRSRMLTRSYEIARDILDAQEMAGATSVLLKERPAN